VALIALDEGDTCTAQRPSERSGVVIALRDPQNGRRSDRRAA